MAEKKTSLRVLYSINGTQYILARSLVPVLYTLIQYEGTPLAGSSSGTPPPTARYGSVSLKTCLDIISRTSPELAHDTSRDFALYVLDPLESNSAPAPMNIPNAGSAFSDSPGEQTRGVAVGYGLMSWARTSAETQDIMANGTLIRQPTGQEALEVVFALRETTVPPQRIQNSPSTTFHTPSSSQESSASQTFGHKDDTKAQWCSKGTNLLGSTSLAFARSASTPNLTRATQPTTQARSKSRAKAPKAPRESAIPVTESDKLLAGDIYIGPLKKKGRPRTTGTEPKSKRAHPASAKPPSIEQEVIVIEGSDNENERSQAKPTPNSQPTPTPLARQNTELLPTNTALEIKTELREPTVLDLLTLFTAPSSQAPADSNVPNAALLAALNAIDSSNPPSDPTPPGTAPNPVLVEALRQLLSVCSQPSQPIPSAVPTTTTSAQTASTCPPAMPQANLPSTQTSRPTPHQQPESPGSQNDVVLLDKENVQPSAFRKRVEKEALDRKSSSGSSSSNSERLVNNLGLSSRANAVQSVSAPLKSSASLPGPDRGVRKRTLSDFMDEKESGRKKEKGKGRERRDSSRQRAQPQPDALRHYPGVLGSSLPRAGQTNYYRTPLEPWTSPARPRENDENAPSVNAGSSTSRSPPKQLSPRSHKVPASSPIRPSKDHKKYVVPAWAKTNTATQPRLSEEAQRAIEEAEEKKKQERNAARRKFANSGAKLSRKSSMNMAKSDPPAPRPTTEHPRAQFLIPRQPAAAGPIAACSDGPIIAFPLIASSSRSSSPPPNPPLVLRTPKTPSRPRVRSTPGAEDDSLFTPIRRSGASLFGSALSQRTPKGTPPSVLTSPLGNRKKAKITPTRSLLTGKGITPLRWPMSGSPKLSSDSVTSEDQSSQHSLPLRKEGDGDLEDLDCPPSSLPIASSDMDIIDSQSQNSSGTGAGDDDRDDTTLDADEDDTIVRPIKQHWAGLPPSSPPPSSPMLIPQEPRDDEMDELPIATSDSENDAEMSGFETDGPTPNDSGLLVADDAATNESSEHHMPFTEDDYNAFFSMEVNPSSTFQQPSSSTAFELFEQFTNVNAQSDDIQTPDMYSFTSPEGQIDPIDFTEFWETFKPLLDSQGHEQADSSQSTENQQLSNDFFTSDDAQGFTGVDATKLADDMRALLSGCLM